MKLWISDLVVGRLSMKYFVVPYWCFYFWVLVLAVGLS